MSQDIKTDWNQNVLNNINETFAQGTEHNSIRDEQVQAKQAVKNLMKDRQVRKAIELLAAE